MVAGENELARRKWENQVMLRAQLRLQFINLKCYKFAPCWVIFSRGARAGVDTEKETEMMKFESKTKLGAHGEGKSKTVMN